MRTQNPEGILIDPVNSNGKAVLVLHAWWGLNSTIESFCERLATQGFVVFAPDLYHGRIAKTIEQAEELATALDDNQGTVLTEIIQSVKYLADFSGTESGMTAIGFSLGAYYALQLSSELPEMIEKVVLFYGSGPADFLKAQAEYLAHFAGNDPYEPQENIEYLKSELDKAGRPVTIFTYPGVGHWFFEPDRKDAYNEGAAELAWERTLNFLNLD